MESRSREISNYNRSLRNNNYHRSTSSILQMRDLSSANVFQMGDVVQVISNDVLKNGINLKDQIGIVQETWEKCDVDPTCCCAEFVDEHFAVLVKFKEDGILDGGDDGDGASNGKNSSKEGDEDEDGRSIEVKSNLRLPIVGINDNYYTQYFAEDELIKVLY